MQYQPTHGHGTGDADPSRGRTVNASMAALLLAISMPPVPEVEEVEPESPWGRPPREQWPQTIRDFWDVWNEPP